MRSAWKRQAARARRDARRELVRRLGSHDRWLVLGIAATFPVHLQSSPLLRMLRASYRGAVPIVHASLDPAARTATISVAIPVTTWDDD